MRNRLIPLAIFSIMLLVSVEGSLQGSQIVNCASCFSQKWEWSSWQCDVHCNVQKSPYGKDELTGRAVTSHKVNLFGLCIVNVY